MTAKKPTRKAAKKQAPDPPPEETGLPLAEKVRRMEVRNVLQKLKSGKTLSTAERKILDTHVAGEGEPQQEVKTWSELGKVLGITVNTLRAWRSEKDSPKTKDVSEWKRFITERKAGIEGKGGGRILVDGETFTAEDIRKFKAQYQKAIAIKEEFNGKLRELEYRQKAESLVPQSELTETLMKTLTPLRRLLDALPRQVSSMANPQNPNIAELAVRNVLDERVFAEIEKILTTEQPDD